MSAIESSVCKHDHKFVLMFLPEKIKLSSDHRKLKNIHPVRRGEIESPYGADTARKSGLCHIRQANVDIDPVERYDFRNFVREYSEMCIILYVTHVVSDIKDIAKKVISMRCFNCMYV